MKARLRYFRKAFYQLSRNRLSLGGLAMVAVVMIMAIFAPFIAPYPDHAGNYMDFKDANKPPSWRHWFGTDYMGRDVLSRIIFGFRYSLLLGVVVLALVVPVGVSLGLLAGYFHGSLIDTIIMRITDIFLALPPLILALAITAILTPNLFNAMLAVSLAWWPWYCRLAYGMVCTIRNEDFVRSAEVFRIPRTYIIFREILPNCLPGIMTKMTLDVGIVILVGASLSFVGLGVQPPTPDLGTMVADGSAYIPQQWWTTIFSALAIAFVVMGFNVLGDGLRDAFSIERT